MSSHLPHHIFSSQISHYNHQSRHPHANADGSHLQSLSPWAMHHALRGTLREGGLRVPSRNWHDPSVLAGRGIAVEAITPSVEKLQ